MRDIVQMGHPALRAKSAVVPIDEIPTSRIQTIIAEMKETLRPEKLGVAIAAPQIGETVRIFVISGKVYAARARPREEYDPKLHPDHVFINPEISRMSKKLKPLHEGCLSLRDKWGRVPRAEKLTVKAYDEHGKPFTQNMSGLLAHIVQHEFDHLEGILYCDTAIEMYDDEGDEEHEPHHDED